ncbi:MAG TPA: deoxyribonuclease IV, partial [Bacteroidota bacterium]|nr:deoxyribonuclease IV [Bacteroidota bacterium]
FARGERSGCLTIQVFTKNNSRWSAPPYDGRTIERFRAEAARSGISPVYAHATYLINLCATDERILGRSREALADELTRCAQLGIAGLIVHPGAHGGNGETEGIRLIAESIDEAHARTPGCTSLTVLETTAGQGTAVGNRFEQLGEIISRVIDERRTAVCIDTCHLFAAGYAIGTAEGWNRTMEEFDRVIGLSRLAAVHVNDSRREMGSRVDRHEHIGKGMIGLEGFRALMNDVRLQHVPKILETDKSEDMHEDVANMALLRSLIRGSGPESRGRLPGA